MRLQVAMREPVIVHILNTLNKLSNDLGSLQLGKRRHVLGVMVEIAIRKVFHRNIDCGSILKPAEGANKMRIKLGSSSAICTMRFTKCCRKLYLWL